MFLNFNIFSNLNSNCSTNLLDLRNLQEQVKKLFWPSTVGINGSSDLKSFANSLPSASNFKSFSRSLDQFFLTVCQNNFGSKILFSQNIEIKCLHSYFIFSNFRSELAGLLRECLVLAPPAVFLALAILNQFAQTAPTSSERKDQRELQEIGKVQFF